MVRCNIYREKNRWSFPESIDIAEIHNCSEIFNSIEIKDHLYFDLSETRSIHASFVGFLLMAKNESGKKGYSLNLNLSEELESLFALLKIRNHFTVFAAEEKTA